MTSPRVLITQISPSPALQHFPITFTCEMDGIAQENNETFTLTIEMDPVFLGTKPEPIIRDRMTGIIQDSDCKLVHTIVIMWVIMN